MKEADAIRSFIEEIEVIRNGLHVSNEVVGSLHAAHAMRSLQAKMDSDVALVLQKARVVKAQLELLERAAEGTRALPEFGPRSSDDRARTLVLGGLKSKLKGSMDAFAELRKEITTKYQETVARQKELMIELQLI